MNPKSYPVWVWSLQRLIGHPKFLLSIYLLISVLIMVLHNSFIFSLAFVMIFSSFHLYTLMNFVICFAGVAEGRAFAVEWKFPGLRNFATCEILLSQGCEISRGCKISYARTVHFPPSSSSTTFRFLRNTLIFPDF